MGAAAPSHTTVPLESALGALAAKFQQATSADVRVDAVAAVAEGTAKLPLQASDAADIVVETSGAGAHLVILRMKLATLAELVGLAAKLSPEEIADLRDAGAWNAQRRGAFQAIGSVVGEVFGAISVELHVPADLAHDACVAGAVASTLAIGTSAAAPLVLTRAAAPAASPSSKPGAKGGSAPAAKSSSSAPARGARAAQPAAAGAPSKTMRPGPWIVAASDAAAKAIESAAAALGVSMRRAEVESAPALGRENVVIVELADGGAAEEAMLRRALRARAMPVALLPEPTLERFARAVRAGALDVIAGRPTSDAIAVRAAHWSMPRPRPAAL